MTNQESPRKEEPIDPNIGIAEQLRLFPETPIVIPMANFAIVRRLAEQQFGFYTLILMSPEGRLTHEITEVYKLNRHMLDTLYNYLEIDRGEDTERTFTSNTDRQYRRYISEPNGLIIIESLDTSSDWASFRVVACTPNSTF